MAALVLTAFLARGVALLCVLPPLEGWDEYQHLAYLEHLNRYGEAPVLGKAAVPRALVEAAAGRPQPALMVEQTRQSGARTYSEYWRGRVKGERPAYRPDHPALKLYQAQHPPLYYWLAAPVYRAAGGSDDLPNAAAAVRLMNLLLGTAAYAALIGFFRLAGCGPASTGLLALLAGLQPLWLLNFARTSNDALAVLLGTVVVAGTLAGGLRRPLAAAALGLLLGAACWTKGLALPLIPFVLCYGLVAGGRQPAGRRTLQGAALAAGIALVAWTPLAVRSLREHGTWTSMQEAAVLAGAGSPAWQTLASAFSWFWPQRLAELWLVESLWTGGWSFLQLPGAFYWTYAAVLTAGLAGWMARFRTRRAAPGNHGVTAGCALLVLWISAALAWHLIQSRLAWGYPATNAWYAATAFPFLLLLFYRGAGGWGRTAKWGLGWLLAAVFLASEAFGTYFKMVPHYAGGLFKTAGLARISELQPFWLSPATFWAASAVAGAALALFTAGWLAAACEEMQTVRASSPEKAGG